jgi:tRNA (uracil-5-)-methyltransferase
LTKDYSKKYLTQFNEKKLIFTDFFQNYTSDLSFYKSPEKGFRTRAEFGFKSHNANLNFTMVQNKTRFNVDKLDICHPKINTLMGMLKEELSFHKELYDYLFQVEFQVSRNEDSFITLIYHKVLDSEWHKEAQLLSKKILSSIIGRSRNQKIIIGKDFIEEEYKVCNSNTKILLYEQCFSQPNPYACDHMLTWTKENISNYGNLVELYCGIGTFTIPLASCFDSVLATENNRSCRNGLMQNLSINNITNVHTGRLSGEETLEAVLGKRLFRRLDNIDLRNNKYETLFLDPPRDGLNDYTIDKMKDFKQIIYMSCGFNSLIKDLKKINKSHNIVKAALFDQFPFTDHMETGVLLTLK